MRRETEKNLQAGKQLLCMLEHANEEGGVLGCKLKKTDLLYLPHAGVHGTPVDR
jgi:hypothetical protein